MFALERFCGLSTKGRSLGDFQLDQSTEDDDQQQNEPEKDQAHPAQGISGGRSVSRATRDVPNGSSVRIAWSPVLLHTSYRARRRRKAFSSQPRASQNGTATAAV